MIPRLGSWGKSRAAHLALLSQLATVSCCDSEFTFFRRSATADDKDRAPRGFPDDRGVRRGPPVGKTLPMPPPGNAQLSRREKCGLALFGLLVVGFGAI